MKRHRALPYILIAPALVFVFVFTLLPLGSVLVGSFFKHKLNIPKYQDPVFAGFSNFSDLFGDTSFTQVLSNTGLYLLLVVPLSIVVALALALLVEDKIRGLAFFRLAIFHPTVLPMVSAATVWMFFFTPDYGLWNQGLHALGYSGPQNWIANPNLALIALAIVAFWKNVGFFMLFFLAGLQGMDRSLVEAARIDGAGGLRLVRRIVLPLIRRQTVFVSTIAFIGAFQTVDHVIVLTQGGPSGTSATLLFYLWQVGFDRFDLGQANAITVILVAVLLVFTVSNFMAGERREK